MVSTNVLCDTTGFSCYNIRVTDIVEQRSLTMVNVTHDSYNWSTGFEVFSIICFILFFHFHLLFHINELNLKAKFTCNQFNYFCIQALVDRYHDTQAHTLTNDFSKTHIQQTSQLTHTDEFRQLNFVINFTFSTSLHLFALQAT